jgi:hypothetical protein
MVKIFSILVADDNHKLDKVKGFAIYAFQNSESQNLKCLAIHTAAIALHTSVRGSPNEVSRLRHESPVDLWFEVAVLLATESVLSLPSRREFMVDEETRKDKGERTSMQ